jgi:hypothetical protein
MVADIAFAMSAIISDAALAAMLADIALRQADIPLMMSFRHY